MDRQTSDFVRESYNKIADAYARHYADELQHKPLDRELLSRFAADVKGRVEPATRPVSVVLRDSYQTPAA
jgi:hypothetical protein